MDTNRLPKQALQYKPKGRRNIGRPRKRWRDQLHLEDQGTGNTPNPSGTWWWWWSQMMKLHSLIWKKQTSYKQYVDNLIVTLCEAQLWDVWNPRNVRRTRQITQQPRIPNYAWFRNKNSSEFRNWFLTDKNSQCWGHIVQEGRGNCTCCCPRKFNYTNCGGYVMSNDCGRRSRKVNTNVA